MLSFFMQRLLQAGLLLAPFAVGAQLGEPSQAVATAGRADGLTYVSVFDNYRNWQELSVSSWADSNRVVRELGGWRAYAKQAEQPHNEAQGNRAARAVSEAHHDHGARP